MAQHRCPNCGGKTVLQADMHYCPRCKGLWDDDPDEGLTAIHNDPVRNAEMKEREAQRRNGRRR